jgi:uncharacterized tellurite resistance protein B-like protein
MILHQKNLFMGLFEALFKNKNVELVNYSPTTIQEAYMAIFYSILYADQKWSEKESKALKPILMRLRVFEDENISYYIDKVETEHTIFGAQALINGGLELISQKFRPQLFCLCAELVLADGKVHEEEEKILDYLAKASNISEELAKKIVEVTMIRMMN